MKKVVLSLSLILLFVFYIAFQRSNSEGLLGNPPIVNEERKSGLPSQTPVSPPSSPYKLVPVPVSPNNDTPSPTPPPSIAPSPTPPPVPVPVSKTGYKDGEYTGDVADAYYGNVQVKVSIHGGKVSDVQFLQYPNDRRTSVQINTEAMPYLKKEAIQAQSAEVDIVSGATQTSLAYRESLASALQQSRN